MTITQYDLLDAYKQRRPLRTPFGVHYVECLTRISELEYQLWLRPAFAEVITPYYLKLNKPGYIHILYRWEEDDCRYPKG